MATTPCLKHKQVSNFAVTTFVYHACIIALQWHEYCLDEQLRGNLAVFTGGIAILFQISTGEGNIKKNRQKHHVWNQPFSTSGTGAPSVIYTVAPNWWGKTAWTKVVMLVCTKKLRFCKLKFSQKIAAPRSKYLPQEGTARLAENFREHLATDWHFWTCCFCWYVCIFNMNLFVSCLFFGVSETL